MRLLCLALAALPAATFAGGPSDHWPAPVTDDLYLPVDRAEAELGRLLFWDPVLSGNRNISCATCHHPRFATADGLALGVGEGGIGLGPDRRADPDNPPEERIPRNSPALFNLGAREMTVLFHDGRVQADASRPSGMRTPMEDEMLTGFSGVLSAQTMFPVLSADEMAGHYSENDVAQAVRLGMITGSHGAWDILSARVAAIPEYRQRFDQVYPEIAAGRDIGFTDISNAIAAFVAFEWRSDGSQFDAVLRGERQLDGTSAKGAELFFGDGGCAACHSGPFQTDQGFHAMGVPQFGPGKAARFENHTRDEGRMEVTGNPADAFAFRTPSLRNVEFTGPYGHTGAFAELSDFVQFHADPVAKSNDIVVNVHLPKDIDPRDTPVDPVMQAEILSAVTTRPVTLDDADIAALVAFLRTLSDPVALAGRLGIPGAVPSGSPIDR
ncbi:cytochrome-c peroxidase [Oceaniovalibus sp. ACAM 378]|uniref:cytochrome-c peroxidase n=1 Tax=Oceaniovalibus sp. ACAM 378 TaxID=2599923 RepID=UPI0011D8078F|nr:cytochrome c peroxidase [Oceaniovalibus sp. ACAM 378]TYB85070.1 cytochrome-c peroxidase [Oceaniovalibus sp. ACAM 378]